ncbi:DUF2971 domain-containing protein [Aeromonas caviae]|uniref:DUF2971 domain-containing protein n=1 Tax=Aeromonas caviae TaxID=648 RepID=UPI0029DCFD56|nr:DUF2971 domain-containing protein [Aeromonas caviae]MDX7755709.1 DUF2971 domain-containing protein [Aeromonas caviae]MDX7774601.1 DUF2971 domain-containing protein [Aeromonas caviae]
MKPEVLYKYRDDSERTEDIIKNQKVWLSSPEQLNDPLECRTGEIPPEWEARTVRELENGQLMGVVMRPPSFKPPKRLFSLSERETKQWVKRFSKLNHPRKVKAMRKLYSDHGIELSRPENIIKDMRKRLSEVGIFSLSEDCSNELMWAHYGENHKGIALGFSSSSDCKLSSQRHCLPVIYSREKPTFKSGFKNEVQIMLPGSGQANVQRVSFEDEVFRSTISTKTPAWSYEKEWRYVEERHGLFDFPGILSYVVFGLRMSEERKEYYKELVSQNVSNHVDFYDVVETEDLSGLSIVKVQEKA